MMELTPPTQTPSSCRSISPDEPTSPESEVKCRLCSREFTDPRVMTCLHVFCLECIVGCRVAAGTFECKICQELTYVQTDDPKNLHADLGLANFIEHKRFTEGRACCVLCSSDQSTLKAFCFVCQGLLCLKCKDRHFDMDYFTKCKGFLYSIEDYIGQDLWKLKQPKCFLHGSFTSYFCSSCNTSKCPNCIADVCQRAGHRYDRLETCTVYCREAMKAAVDSSQRKLHDVHSKHEDLQAQMTSLRRDYQAALNRIDEITNHTMDQVMDRSNRLKEDVNNAYAVQELRINNDLKEITRLELAAIRAIKFQDRLDRHATTTQAIVFKPMIDRYLMPLQRFDLTSVSGQYGLRVVGFVPQNFDAAVQNTMGYVETGKPAWFSNSMPANSLPGNRSSALDVFNFSQFELPNLSLPSQPATDPIIGTWGNPPATANGGGDIFSTADMFVSDTIPSRSRDLPKSASVQRQKMVYSAKFGEFGTGSSQFTEPSGVAVNNKGEIFVADTNNHRIQVFGKDGVFRRQIGENGKNDGQMVYPNRVAVCPKSGNIVITERPPTHQVQVFTPDGRFVRKFGQGTIQHPRGITVDNHGRIIVIECKVMRVIIFDENGEQLKMFECSKHLQFPNGVVVNDREEIFISDNRSHCVKVFSYSGAYLRSIGGESITNYPIGVCMSSTGELWVADNHNNFNVTVFTQKGDMVAALESRVKHAQCFDVALSNDGSIIVASKDFRVYIYHLGNDCNGGSTGNGASGSLAGNESNGILSENSFRGSSLIESRINSSSFKQTPIGASNGYNIW